MFESGISSWFLEKVFGSVDLEIQRLQVVEMGKKNKTKISTKQDKETFHKDAVCPPSKQLWNPEPHRKFEKPGIYFIDGCYYVVSVWPPISG